MLQTQRTGLRTEFTRKTEGAGAHHAPAPSSVPARRTYVDAGSALSCQTQLQRTLVVLGLHDGQGKKCSQKPEDERGCNKVSGLKWEQVNISDKDEVRFR